MIKPSQQWSEPRFDLLLTRRRYPCHGSPVKGSVKSQDFKSRFVTGGVPCALIPKFSCQLDHRLIGFGAAIGEKNLACRANASMIRGCAWPRVETAIPAPKSKYSFPSSSHTREPSPRTKTTSYRP